MDRLVTRIAGEHADDKFLESILGEIELQFGNELHFRGGHCYEEVNGEFVLRVTVGDEILFSDSFSSTSLTALNLIEHGTFIFDSPNDGPELYAPPRPADLAPVAFLISLPPVRKWVFVYGLADGWDREEISFCMNGTRFALLNRMKVLAAESDLDKAAAIQKSLLPKRPPVFSGYDIAGRTRPAEAVGGDLYDFISLSDDILGLAIGDASGHGLSAALLVRDVIVGIRMGMGTHLKMLYTMKKLNTVIHRTTFSTRFISVFYSELEENGNVLYVNAGHVPGLLFDADGTVEMLEPTGMILGAIPELPLDRAYAHIPKGGMLVLFTDGITERVSPTNEPFEVDGLIGVISDHKKLPAEQLVECIFERAFEFEHESDLLEDDATVVVVKRNS